MAGYIFLTYNASTLTVAGGTLIAPSLILTGETSRLFITGGHLKATTGTCFFTGGTSATVTGGTFETPMTTVQLDRGTLDLSNYPDPLGLTLFTWTGGDVSLTDVLLPDGYSWYTRSGELVDTALLNGEFYVVKMPGHVCDDSTGDGYCDGCGESLECLHDFDVVEPNGNGTHEGICLYCGDLITEDCYRSGVAYENKEEHFATCFCGYDFPPEPHCYEEQNIASTAAHGHEISCDECGVVLLEEHTDANADDRCDVCDEHTSNQYKVYIGPFSLTEGQYLDMGGAVTTEKPESGYAYYSSGVLELNNFTFTGNAPSRACYTDSSWEFSTVYLPLGGTVLLRGENTLTSPVPVDGAYDCGIYTGGALTIQGDGTLTVTAGQNGICVERGDFTLGGTVTLSVAAYDAIYLRDGDATVLEGITLNISAEDDGIYVVDGDMTIEGGTLTLGKAPVYDELGELLENEQLGDDAIDLADGDLIINGGTIYINSDDHSFDIDGSVTVTGGTLTLLSGDDGINADGEVLISGGKITVNAADYAIDGGESGTVTVTGGEIDVIARCGLYSNVLVRISGGKITAETLEFGVSAYEVMITGGSFDIEAGYEPIGAYAAEILGGSFNFDPLSYAPRDTEIVYDAENEIWTVEKTISMMEAEGRINELETALKDVTALNATVKSLEKKNRSLQTLVIVTCILSAVAVCGCAAVGALTFLGKKKVK